MFPGKAVTFDPSTGIGDYLTWLAVVDSNSSTQIVTGDFDVLMYWVTKDGLMVTGTTQREIIGIDNKAKIDKTDTEVLSTITVAAS